MFPSPHNDKQAEDRAYRMGQKRDVHVIKLITKDTLEEDMLALADTKLKLDSEVSSSTQYPSGAAGAPSGGLAEVAEGGDMAGAEKRMKSSLLSNLKKKVSSGGARRRGVVGLAGADGFVAVCVAQFEGEGGSKSPVKTRPRRGVVEEEAPAKEEDTV